MQHETWRRDCNYENYEKCGIRKESIGYRSGEVVKKLSNEEQKDNFGIKKTSNSDPENEGILEKEIKEVQKEKKLFNRIHKPNIIIILIIM